MGGGAPGEHGAGTDSSQARQQTPNPLQPHAPGSGSPRAPSRQCGRGGDSGASHVHPTQSAPMRPGGQGGEDAGQHTRHLLLLLLHLPQGRKEGTVQVAAAVPSAQGTVGGPQPQAPAATGALFHLLVSSPRQHRPPQAHGVRVHGRKGARQGVLLHRLGHQGPVKHGVLRSRQQHGVHIPVPLLGVCTKTNIR